jgi:hypothetical protein
MNEIDKLLEGIKSQYQKKQEQPQQQSEVKPSLPEKISQGDHQLSPTDKLLAQVKAQFEQNKNSQEAIASKSVPDRKTSLTESLLTDIKTEFQQKEVQQRQQQDVGANYHPPVLQRAPSTHRELKENFIQELQAEYQEKKKIEQEQEKKQHLAEIQQQELQKQKRRQALVRQAQEWLKNLDPHSDEGFWFEQFSQSYESKLEAAIDYLEALGGT